MGSGSAKLFAFSFFETSTVVPASNMAVKAPRDCPPTPIRLSSSLSPETRASIAPVAATTNETSRTRASQTFGSGDASAGDSRTSAAGFAPGAAPSACPTTRTAKPCVAQKVASASKVRADPPAPCEKTITGKGPVPCG